MKPFLYVIGLLIAVLGLLLAIMAAPFIFYEEPELPWEGQWGGEMIGADLAYNAGYRGQGVTIAFIDTGIDFEHGDFASLNIQGRNWAHGPDYAYHDSFGHGSHVAGLAVSQEPDFMGAAPEATILGLKGLSDYGYGYFEWIAAAIDYASDRADIISMSFSAPVDGSQIRAAIEKAAAKGVLLISSGGNQGDLNFDTWPAAYPEVMAVGAVGVNGDETSFSATRPYIEIMAPGGLIASTCTGFIRDTYYWSDFGWLTHCWLAGTSMSTPLVAAAAAVLLSSPISTAADLNEDGQWSAFEVRKWMIETGRSIRGNPTPIVDLGMALRFGVIASKDMTVHEPDMCGLLVSTRMTDVEGIQYVLDHVCE